MDAALDGRRSFEDFLAAIREAGCEVKRGKHLAFKIPGGKRFVRCASLGDDYTEDAIRERLAGLPDVAPRVHTATVKVLPKNPNLLIDIQAKLQQANSPGFERWARLFNLKEMAKTLIYLQEQSLDDYGALAAAADAASAEYHTLSDKAKTNSTRMKDISELQKQMAAYRKTRDVYMQYVRGGRKASFYEEHRAAIALHEAAKKHFDACGYGRDNRLPGMDSLKREYAVLAAENKKIYPRQNQARAKMVELLTAKNNADRILDLSIQREHSRGLEQEVER